MQQAANTSSQPMPLFFKRIVAIDPKLHGNLRLDRTNQYRFAAKVQAVPIGLTEFDIISQHYPILFTIGPNPVPVALLSLREGDNLFVQPTGQWLDGAYIPAYVRCFPFISVEDAKTKTTVVGIEPDADQFRSSLGQRLFEDGRPAPLLSDTVAFCQAFRESANAAASLGRALEAARLLEEEEATVNFTAGGASRIRGFKLVKQERMAEIDDTTFLDWRRTGFLNGIYAHLFSASRWGRLIDLSAPKPAARAS